MKPVFHHMRLDDPGRAADHPALAEMLAKGWSVGANFVGEREGQPELVLLLVPPPANQRPARHYLFMSMATALGAAVGALVALLVATA